MEDGRLLAKRINNDSNAIYDIDWVEDTEFERSVIGELIRGLKSVELMESVSQYIQTAWSEALLDQRGECYNFDWTLKWPRDELENYLHMVVAQGEKRRKLDEETRRRLRPKLDFETLKEMLKQGIEVLPGVHVAVDDLVRVEDAEKEMELPFEVQEAEAVQARAEAMEAEVTAEEEPELQAVRDIFQKYYTPNGYESLMCIEVVLQDHGVIETTWEHTFFLRKMIEWQCLSEMDAATLRKFSQRLSKEVGKLGDAYKNLGYREWGISLKLKKEKCIKMGQCLGDSFPYQRVSDSDV